MAENDLPSDISKPERLDPTRGIGPNTGENEEAPEKPFSTYMKEPGPGSNVEATKPSPFDVAGGSVAPTGQPTLESVNAQMKAASSTLGDLNEQLNTPKLKLKRSQNYLLRNKLGDANQNIRQSVEKLGVQPGKLAELKGRDKQNPVFRFINLVTDSQHQIKQAQTKIHQMTKDGQSVQPGKLLAVQVKLNKATQQLEYASVLLSNAVSSIKMMFNVQI